MAKTIVSAALARIYKRSRSQRDAQRSIRAMFREAALRVRDTILDNIDNHRSGGGQKYPLTKTNPPRIPFQRVADKEWQVHENAGSIEVRPASFWWEVHQKGAVIRPRHGRYLWFTVDGRRVRASQVVLPARNPVPGRRKIESIMRQVAKEY